MVERLADEQRQRRQSGGPGLVRRQSQVGQGDSNNKDDDSEEEGIGDVPVDRRDSSYTLQEPAHTVSSPWSFRSGDVHAPAHL